MKQKGVCYDIGWVMLAGDWRPDFDPKIAHRDLGIVKNDLHCNAVRICGRDIDRLKAIPDRFILRSYNPTKI